MVDQNYYIFLLPLYSVPIKWDNLELKFINWGINMVGKLIGLAIGGIAKIATALANFMSDPMPIIVHDNMNNEKHVAICVTTPHKIEKQKIIGLVLVGNIDENIANIIDRDLEAGIAHGDHLLLVSMNKTQMEKGKFQMKEFPFADYQFTYNEVKDFGLVLSMLKYKYKTAREYIKSVTNAKNIKFDEEDSDRFIRAKADKYVGDYVLKYWEKGLFGESEWVIPGEGVKFWQHIYQFNDPDTIPLAKELFDSYSYKKIDKSKESQKRFDNAQKSLKEYIKAQQKTSK